MNHIEKTFSKFKFRNIESFEVGVQLVVFSFYSKEKT